MSAATELVPSSMEGPDGITAGDRLRAELGRRVRAEYPAAITDPAAVAAIRRRMEAHRALPAWRQRLIAADWWLW